MFLAALRRGAVLVSIETPGVFRQGAVHVLEPTTPWSAGQNTMPRPRRNTVPACLDEILDLPLPDLRKAVAEAVEMFLFARLPPSLEKARALGQRHSACVLRCGHKDTWLPNASLPRWTLRLEYHGVIRV
ncbi:hypothetical protein GCM10010278_71640 [Streptomyces melanogenes]|nr:hypothetical protein GCM10010278_71640 [Streptomyces melanogenes]